MKTKFSLFIVCVYCTFTIAQWVKVDSLYGGSISALLSSDYYLFASVMDNGVYRSSDVGENWIPINSGLMSERINTLAASENYIFAGTSGEGIFRSTNNGDSWTAANTGLPNNYLVRSIIPIPDGIGGTRLFAAGSSSTISTSTDFGNSWTLVNPLPLSMAIYSMAASGIHIFVGGSGGVCFSTDNGINWTSAGLTDKFIFGLSIKGEYIFAATSNSGIFRTNINSINWQSVNSGITNLGVRSILSTQSGLYAGTSGGGVFLSSNLGADWTPLNSELFNKSILSLSLSDSGLIAGTNGSGILRFSDGENKWINISNGIMAVNVNSIVTMDDELFIGTLAGVFKLEDGQKWISLNNGLTSAFVYSLLVSGTKLFAGTTEGVFISSNKGEDWSSANTGLTTQWVYRLATLDNFLFAGTLGGGVFRSSDEGNQWIQVNNGLGLSSIYCLHATSTHLFAGPGQIFPGGTYFTQNHGAEWQLSGLTPGALVYDITHIGNRLFAGLFAGSVRISDDNGISWTYSGSGLTNENIRCFTVSTSHIFAGAGGIVIPGMPVGGVFHSSNNGSSWVPIIGGLPDATVISLGIHNEYLFAGLYWKGLWKLPLSVVVTSGEIYPGLPEKFELCQNYPNPFNPSTKITWQAPADGKQTLKVFDVLGNEIAVLVDEFRPAGRYEATFDAGNLASGIYIYRLQAGDPSAGSGQSFIQTKKMILLR